MSDLASPSMASPEPAQPVSQAGARALQVLAQQVEGARTQMDGAVLDLSQRFAALHSGLAKSVGAADAVASAQSGATVAEVFAQSREQLSQVVERLQQALQQRGEAARQAQGVTEHTTALQGLVERVAALAARTDLLALNATIEAARAGEHGRGFSIVAEEVRKLSAQSRRTSEDMAQRVQAIGGEMQSLAKAAARSNEQERTTFAAIDESVQSVLARLQQLAQAQQGTAATLRAEGEQARREIERVMVALQFGDRVSQILDQAARALQDLSANFDAAGAGFDGEAALARVAEGYTTQEQRLTHEGVQAAGDEESSDITFF